MPFDFICPFCGQKHTSENDISAIHFECLGEFYLHIAACKRGLSEREYTEQEKDIAWAKLAYYIVHKYLYYKREVNTGLDPIDWKWVLDNVELPTPAQQADLLIDFVGRKTKVLGSSCKVDAPEFGGGYYQLKAWIGGAGPYSVQRIFEYLVSKELLRAHETHNSRYFKLELTLAGWNRLEELQQVNKESKLAFMAMKFDDEQKQFIKDKLKPIVKETGFDLLLLTDINSKENLIDNKLRVAIRQSRFLICDLTHCNAGAYWEAGYAEGLKLPVIYICEKSAFDADDKSKRPHFDVNHQEIFQWDKNDEKSIKDFLENIKAKIQIMIE